VIFKARVTCTSTSFPTLQVRVTGTLYRLAGGSISSGPAAGPGLPVASSNKVQTVPTNGATVTFYTPLVNGTNVNPGSGATFYGIINVQITAPGPSNLGSAVSHRCFVNKSYISCN
jgi:hypothetical protein